MSPELVATIIGFLVALTSLIKQTIDKNKISKQSDENSVKTNEQIAVLQTKVKMLEAKDDKADIRFQGLDSELKNMNATLNQILGMLTGLKGKGV